MKTLLVGINSKYIHTNVAIRYLKANTTYETTLKEFTIKDDENLIYKNLLEDNPEIICFSAYLWNIEIIKSLTRRIKTETSCIVVWGGPEVSYQTRGLMTSGPVDFIISQEGEIAFHQLLDALHLQKPYKDIPNLTYRDNQEVFINQPMAVPNLNALHSPYYFETDYKDIPNRIQYVESSRGCPYRCSYCLASLDKDVRYFDINRVKNELLHLMKLGAKTFKFLDRTFNLNKKIAIELFDFIIHNHMKNTVFQFEITGDILPFEVIDFINQNAPKNLIRFEIGIQSTSEKTNLSVNRHQNTKQLFDLIRYIQKDEIIDLHLDLIAGLPYETLERFKQTFNEVFSLHAKELQLGFLKMLKGTKLRDESKEYGYLYSDSPPYEIIHNNYISSLELNQIHIVEEMLELYYNKGFMPTTIKTITNKVKSSFDFFYDLGVFYQENGFSTHRYQLHDVFDRLDKYIKINFTEDYPYLLDQLKFDYLIYSNIKPKIWWDNSSNMKNILVRKFYDTNQSIHIDDLYKYSLITNYQDGYLLFFYKNNQKQYFTFQ